MKHRAAWTSHLQSRSNGSAPKISKAQRLRLAREEHDALENTCRDIALARYGIELYKTDAGAVRMRSSRTGEDYFVTRCKSGFPDRLAVIPPTGRFAGFEFKINPDDPKLRDNQEKVHNALTAAGGATYTINSVRMFEECLRMLLDIEAEKYDHWHNRHQQQGSADCG